MIVAIVFASVVIVGVSSQSYSTAGCVPHYGDTLYFGFTYLVNWSSSNIPSGTDVSVAIYQCTQSCNNGPASFIQSANTSSTVPASQGYIYWYVDPTLFSAGSQFFVVVSDGNGVASYSSGQLAGLNYFTIAQAPVSNVQISPSPCCSAGQQYSITWQLNVVFETGQTKLSPSPTVNVSLYQGSGSATLINTIAMFLLSSTQPVLWTPSTSLPAGTDYFIAVILLQDSTSYGTSVSLSINEPAASSTSAASSTTGSSTTGSSGGGGDFSMVNPLNGANLILGNCYNITWTFDSAVSSSAYVDITLNVCNPPCGTGNDPQLADLTNGNAPNLGYYQWCPSTSDGSYTGTNRYLWMTDNNFHDSQNFNLFTISAPQTTSVTTGASNTGSSTTGSSTAGAATSAGTKPPPHSTGARVEDFAVILRTMVLAACIGALLGYS